MSATPAIETRALRKSYGDVVALGGVDLSVEAGIVFGPPRPERSGEDDRRQDPDDAPRPRRRLGVASPAWTWCARAPRFESGSASPGSTRPSTRT